MDDSYKEYRRNKPQQKLYKPGSGPLRRSCYGLDTKMDTHDIDNGPKNRNQNHYGSQTSINEDFNDRLNSGTRHKKPEQQLYVSKLAEADGLKLPKTAMRSDNSSQHSNRLIPNSSSYSKGNSRRDRPDVYNKDGIKNDINSNRQYRHASETRSISPAHSLREQSSADHYRDTRSMESSGGRHFVTAGAKPPSGRRNSAGYMPDMSRSKYNLDNIPPRFRKQFLEKSGYHSFDSVDQIHKDKNHSNNAHSSYDNFYTPGLSWSQTLPSRGRGRLRDTDGFDREKFMNAYMKSYEVQSSRKSTPSNSYMNLYETSVSDKRNSENTDAVLSSMESPKDVSDTVSINGHSYNTNTMSLNQTDSQKNDDNDPDSETASQISSTLLDMTNLDWTEEVEKNIKLDEMCESTTSFSQNIKPNVNTEEKKPTEHKESRRSGRSRGKDRRSSSRGLKNSEKKSERNRKDSTTSVHQEPEHKRKDSNISIPYDTLSSNLKSRERRDSHRSNRSSTIGNSREDLDRWRSLRSYSREQSTEGRIVSQCNSRDTSANRAASPRDNDGFRVPSSVTKSAAWLSANQKNNGSIVNGRTPSAERGRASPAPSVPTTEGGGGGQRRSRRRSGRNRSRAAPEALAPAPPSQPSSGGTTNWRNEILESKKHTHDKQPDSTHQRNRLNSILSEKSSSESNSHHPGLILLPQGSISHLQKDSGRQAAHSSAENQKTLFDHQNPSKPIIVQTSPSKVDMRMDRGVSETPGRGAAGYEASDAARAARHRALLQLVDRADAVLQTHALSGPLALATHWKDVSDNRAFLQNALHKLLTTDLKYCQADNIEHHFWKILYYNFIEILRKSFSQLAPEDKPKVIKLINVIIEEGNTYFENLVQTLEKVYKFNVDDYINDNHVLPPKGMGYVGLVLISVQKLYVFLGDLARYKEQVNETNNYAKSKFWYTKAQQINPKNGRPYNQLAILAIYARRKLDAVYYYMRSLMSSNPFHSARESLLSLFEENRKKYEAAEKKRRAALEASRSPEEAAEPEGGGAAAVRREVWVRPVAPSAPDPLLASMTSVELNKNFITSYLHVHGKLITKIGMETFYESASLMLRQFRALLHRQPLPTPAARLLQLTALNMFAVESTTAALKGSQNEGERSAWLECALSVSLLMFGAMLERCCALLPEPPQSQHHADAQLLLPAIKVWSDWMLCHRSVWNPPPSFENFVIDTENDPWDWLAKLMNILETLDDKTIEFENEMKEDHVCVRLPEDASLAGFTPLMYMEPAAAWLRSPGAPHSAENTLRLRKMLFFGTEYLVGVEPSVLRLECPADAPPRYVSAVQRAQPRHPPLHHLIEDSESEQSVSSAGAGAGGGAEGADEDTRRLLRRKHQLESKRATMERHRQRVQEIVGSGAARVEVEVRPRWLVPDTNCFIDHLPLLRGVAAAPHQPYTLAVPLVVMTELEGLQRCARVGGAAREALAWVAGAGGGVRLATSRGSLLASRTFTAERELARATNDDRVLATALSLHENLASPQHKTHRGDGVREVILVTEDRNLRVKALAAELPARDLPSFVRWAGLDEDKKKQPTDAESAPIGQK